MRSLSALILCTVLSVASVSANWPAWRGPTDAGVSPEKNLPVSWSDTQNVAWSTLVRGMGVSSPIVWGTRVFVTSQDGASAERQGSHPTLNRGEDLALERTLGGRKQGVRGQASDRIRFVVTALDRDSGKPAWEHVFDAQGDLPEVHEKHNLASPSPVTDGERIYAWFGTGQLVALDMSGKVVWARHIGKEYSPVSILWGPGSSPVVYKDSLILLNYHGAAAYLLSLDAKTGKQRWKTDHTKGVTSYSTPVVVPGPNGPEMIVNASDGVAGFNPDTGARLWYYNEANSFPVAAAVHENGVIYLNRGHRSSPYMAIKLGGKGDISATHVLWRQATSGPYVPSIIQYQGLVYMATDQGIVSAVDAATGERVWQERIPGVYMASPVAGDGKVYLVGETGETLVIEAGRQLKVLARNKLDGRFTASPAIANGRIFLRSDDRVVAIGR
jgi:outer membrane protein assembly factor BamB